MPPALPLATPLRTWYLFIIPSGDAVHISVRGAAQDVAVRLARSSVSMDATYVTMSSQKLVTITNRSDVIAHYRWTCFATPEAEQQHRSRSDEDDMVMKMMMVVVVVSPHRRSQDFVWGCTVFLKKVDDSFFSRHL